MSTKFSQFIVKDVVSDSDYVNVTGSGVNRRVVWPDFLANIAEQLGTAFIYPTIASLQDAPLSADEDDPTYVRVEETGYLLYKITNIAPSDGDIVLDNGNTATYQDELREFDVGTVADLATLSLPIGSKVSTKGCLSIGDGGQGTFIVEAASGSPDGYSRALLANGNHAVLQPVNGEVSVLSFGALLDVDSTAAVLRSVEYSNTTGVAIKYPSGTILSDPIVFASKNYSFLGLGSNKSTLKMNGVFSDHFLATSGTANLNIKGITIDQNSSVNTGGHGIRGGGCDSMILEDVVIQNVVGYGIGIQGGTNNNVKWTRVVVQDTGEDAVDIKDVNYNNGIIVIDDFTAQRYGSSNSSAGLDIRGEIQATNIKIYPNGDRRGLRLRDDASGQGRAAFGNISNITITGTVANLGAALEISSSSRNYVLSNITTTNISSVLHASTARGGIINNLTAVGATTDCMSLFGQDLTFNGLSLQNATGSARLIDVEPTANNIQINAFALNENTTGTDAIRVQSGAVNINLSNGWIRGGTITGAGAGGVTQSNVRFI